MADIVAVVVLALAAVTETARVIAMDVPVVVIEHLVNTCKLQCPNDE